jgi:hypothetical protein
MTYVSAKAHTRLYKQILYQIGVFYYYANYSGTYKFIGQNRNCFNFMDLGDMPHQVGANDTISVFGFFAFIAFIELACPAMAGLSLLG